MRNIKLVIQYDGSRYKGWQRLGKSEMNIQGKIESVLTKMIGENIEIIGSGRTDAGVHAIEQVANFKTKDKKTTVKMMEYLNKYLPDDIVIKQVVEVHERFHARYNVVSKKYMYRIWNDRVQNPFLRKHIVHIPEKIDIRAMKYAATFLLGEHDFSSFRDAKSKKKSSIRTIYAIDISQEEETITIIMHGNGFLHKMVRIIVGTLLEVGLGRMKPEQVEHILAQKDRALAGPTAPPQGLFLYSVEY